MFFWDKDAIFILTLCVFCKSPTLCYQKDTGINLICRRDSVHWAGLCSSRSFAFIIQLKKNMSSSFYWFRIITTLRPWSRHRSTTNTDPPPVPTGVPVPSCFHPRLFAEMFKLKDAHPFPRELTSHIQRDKPGLRIVIICLVRMSKTLAGKCIAMDPIVQNKGNKIRVRKIQLCMKNVHKYSKTSQTHQLTIICIHY